MTNFEPKYSDDRRPRYGVNKNGTVMFWHPCQTCGRVDAPFGYNVRKEHHGEYYCFAHRPDAPPTASTRK